MGISRVFCALLAAAALSGCHAVEVRSNICGGTTACAKAPCDPVEVLYAAPNRPYNVLGVVQVRVDRGSILKNPTLSDALPPLVAEARRMGADAVILTHEEFASWYDKGEDASPIHDLERQETWYITEKARYLSGLAVTWSGAAPAAGYPPSAAYPSAAPTPAYAPTPPPPPPPPAPMTPMSCGAKCGGR